MSSDSTLVPPVYKLCRSIASSIYKLWDNVTVQQRRSQHQQTPRRIRGEKNILHVSHGPPMVGFVLLNSSDCFPNHGLTDNRQLARLFCFPSGQSVANWPEKDCDWPGHILICPQPEVECGNQGHNLPGCTLDPPNLKQVEAWQATTLTPRAKVNGRNLPDCDQAEACQAVTPIPQCPNRWMAVASWTPQPDNSINGRGAKTDDAYQDTVGVPGVEFISDQAPRGTMTYL
ncbi:hypothetical protein B0H13DRAFT_1879772 [Mycena leptocephala]|nr:hypothetical protein B0H13DRAFT_1879772 [Mycena leptocephala]